MPGITDIIADRLVGYGVDIRDYGLTLERSVLGYLVGLEREIVFLIQSSGVNDFVRNSARERRLVKLLGDLRVVIDDVYRDLGLFLVNELRDFAVVDKDVVVNLINNAIGGNIITKDINQGLVRELVSTTLFQGALFSDWVSRLGAGTTERVGDAIRFGLGIGESVTDLVRRVRGTYTGRRKSIIDANGKSRVVPIFRGGILDVSTRQANSIVLTSVFTISNAVREELYAQNGDVIRGKQALVTLDSRTSLICISRSGGSWDLEGKPLNSSTQIPFPGPPPWHWRCRTVLVPVLYGLDDLLDRVGRNKRNTINGLGSTTRASINGAVAADITFVDWLREQSVSFQRRVLGKGRYELWQAGRISAPDLLDPRGNVIKLTDLREMHGG